jgi:hypothetical protein
MDLINCNILRYNLIFIVIYFEIKQQITLFGYSFDTYSAFALLLF